MALNKALATQFGDDVFANYWNIGQIREDFQCMSTEILLCGYSSEDARRTNKQPMANTTVRFEGSAYVADATRSKLYPLIKQIAAFTGAVDC